MRSSTERVAPASALFAFALLALTGCGGERWSGVVYPDADALLVHRSIGDFDSFGACRTASLAYLADMGAAARGDYECGLNCRPSDTDPELNICEATQR